MKSETMLRMEAMQAAGLQPDMLVVVDTLAPDREGNPMLIPNQRWRELYNSNISVRLAYDEAKYGSMSTSKAGFTAQINAHGNIIVCRGGEVRSSYRIVFSGTYKECLQYKDTPQAPAPPVQAFKPKPSPPKERKFMDTALLIATARGHAESVTDPYFAWLLNQLADALEKKG